MKIVISALHFSWDNMEECLDKAVHVYGLDGVELSWHDSFRRPSCTKEDLDALASLKGRYEAALSAHIWSNLAESEPSLACDDLLRWLGECDRTGTGHIVIHGGSYPEQREGITRVRRVLESVLPEYERKQVALHLENHYAYAYHGCNELFSTPWEFREALELDSPSLKFCFDTGHGNMTGNTEALLEELAPWLDYIHLADNHGVDDDHVGYGQGTVAWESVFGQLRRLGFDGTFCVEFPVYEDEGPFRACVDEIRKTWL